MFYWRPFGSDESCQRDAHSWPEKLTSWQAPRPNCAHQLAAFASASACGAILRFEEQEPSAVKPIASHGRSVEAAFGWLDSGPGMGAGLGVTSSIFGGAGIGGGAGRPGAGSGTGDPVDVRAMTKASSGWDNVSEASACRAGEAAIREVVIATADDGAMGRTARIVQVNFKSTSGLSSVSRDRNVPRIRAHHKGRKSKLPWIFGPPLRSWFQAFLMVSKVAGLGLPSIASAFALAAPILKASGPLSLLRDLRWRSRRSLKSSLSSAISAVALVRVECGDGHAAA